MRVESYSKKPLFTVKYPSQATHYFISFYRLEVVSRSGGMADTQRSERCPRKGVEVQVLSSAQMKYWRIW